MARQEICFNHTERPAVGRCRQCHRPLCDECAKGFPEGRFCSFACVEKHKDFAKRNVPAQPKTPSKLLTKFIFLLIILAAVVFVGAKVLKVAFFISILDKLGL